LKKYQHIFFDLDHTLWDFDFNSKQTLSELYIRFDLAAKGGNGDAELLEHFDIVNNELWDKYNNGEISQYHLRNNRFPLVFEAAGINSKLFSTESMKEFNECYLKECSQKPNLIEGAKDLLEYLSQKYVLHIITNGFEEVQGIKMESAGITHYFNQIITSERAGAKKPFPAIFDFALKTTNAALETSIMIGDILKTDIKGALDYGMDQIYFNPKAVPHSINVTHEIRKLTELVTIF